MRTELRPLTLGEILDRTFLMYRSHFTTFVGIAVAGSVYSLVWQAIQLFVLRAITGSHAITPRTLLVSYSLQIPGAILSLIIYGVIYAAMMFNVAAMYRGEPIGVGLMLKTALPHWFRLARTMFLSYLLAFGPVFLGVLAISGMTAFARKITTSAGGAALTAMYAAVGLSFLILIPLAAWLGLRYSLSNSVCAYEGTNARQSLKRSALLVKGLRRRVLALFCIALLVGVVAFFFESIPLWFLHGRDQLHQPLWAMMYRLLIQFFAGVIAAPIFGIGVALFYFDARARKEGLDVEWSLQEPVSAGGTLSGIPVSGASSVENMAPDVTGPSPLLG